MGEIRIVGPGKTRGYPYPVCMIPNVNLACNGVARSKDLGNWGLCYNEKCIS